MLLVLGTTLPGLSMGLFKGLDTPLAQLALATPRAADALHTELSQVFEKNDITAAALTQVALTTGPGSFTGIRIGLAVAQALKLVNPALAIKGLSTLQALALQTVEDHAPQTPFTVLVDAAGQTAYRQTFSAQGAPLTQPECLPLAQALNTPHPIAAATGHLLPVAPAFTFGAIRPAILAAMAQNPALHLAPEPTYLKPLTYKKAGE